MKNNTQKNLGLPLRLALVILIFGALFKVMHWPYAKELMIIGGILIGILYPIRFFNKTDKKQLDYVKLALVLLWVFSYLNQVFHFISIPYILEAALVVLSLWWFVYEGIYFFKSRKFKANRFLKLLYYLLVVLAIITLVFGVLFKIQHWPYGALLFVLGILLLNCILILDYFVFERKE